MSIEVKLCPFHERGDQHRRLKIKHESTPRKPSSTLEKAAVSLRKTPVGIGMLFSDWYNSFFLRILLQKEHNPKTNKIPEVEDFNLSLRRGFEGNQTQTAIRLISN